ncbi:MAG: DNA endonuclease SmrA [Pseudomonadales bacterium]
MSDEENLFSQEMAGVKPLASVKRVQLTPDNGPDPSLLIRRQAATRVVEADSNFLSSDYVYPLGPDDVIQFCRPGVQNGVFKKLRMGKYQLDATLDLHRKTVDESRQEVFEFIRECMRYDVRTSLISHGKGERNADGIAIIKSHVAKWLPEISEVLAVHSAQRNHGGTGSVYVLLKKSDKKKTQAREEFARLGAGR